MNLTNEQKIMLNGVFYGRDRLKVTKEEVVQSLEFNVATTSDENLQRELKGLIEKVNNTDDWELLILSIPFEVDPVEEIGEALIGADGDDL